MRIRWMAAFVVAAAFASTSASTQEPVQRGGIPTETQDRTATGDRDLIWNLIGCLGLLGLRGLWRNSDNDGYTDDPI